MGNPAASVRSPFGTTDLFVSVALLLASGCGGPAGIAGLEDERPIVATSSGPVQGFTPNDKVWAWKGIAYAAPPVGELRWRAPRDPEPWSGVRDTTSSAAQCVQWESARTWRPTGEIVGSEDCLYLDLYRPRSEERGLPVYMWIHGGANNGGSAAPYDGSAIADGANVVVVVTQYRLGPFGWFQHPSLRQGADALDASGNFGTLDHIKALEWVRDNVSAFGGDPNTVTIAGESAGAHNVTNLLVSPLAAGLFHRAISQSGGMTLESGKVSGASHPGDGRSEATIAELIDGYDPADPPPDLADTLRELPAREILRARAAGDGLRMAAHSAYVDDTVIAGDLIDTIASGDYNRVPVILGANEYESKPYVSLYGPALADDGFDNNWQMVHDLFDPEFDPDHTWTFEEVLPTEFDRRLYRVSALYGSRQWRARYVDEIARPLRAQQDDVYAYLFRWGAGGVGPRHFDVLLGASHGMEIVFFFGGSESLFGYSFTPDNEPGRKDLESAMMGYLGRFIHSGDPNGEVELPGWPDGFGDVPRWQPWSNNDGAAKAIVFDADLEKALIEMTVEEDSTTKVAADLEAELAGWSEQQRERYGWIPRAFIW